MTTSISKIITLGVFTAGVAFMSTNDARANEWWQPPGSTETGSATFPDGTTNHELQMPDGSVRIVTTDDKGGMHRYFNPRGKHVRVNKHPPVGGNPYIPTAGQPLCDRTAGCGAPATGGG